MEFQRPGHTSVEIVARRFVGDRHASAGRRLQQEYGRAVERARSFSAPTPRELAGNDYLRVQAGAEGAHGDRVLRHGTVLVTITVHRFGGTRRQVDADLANLGRAAAAVLPR